MNISALFYFQLMEQLREKHPERFDVPVSAAQGRPPRESDTDTDSEHEQTTTTPTGTQTEKPASTSSHRTPSSASGKRKPSHVLLEKIEKRLAANQQQTAQIAQQVKNYFDKILCFSTNYKGARIAQLVERRPVDARIGGS